MKKNSIKRILVWFMALTITLGTLGILNASAEGVEQHEPFSADIKIKQLTEGPLYYDDSVELLAKVSNANRAFSIVWEVAQVKPGEELKWSQFATGEKQILAVNRSYSSYLYRAGAKAEDGDIVYSEVYQISEPMEREKEKPEPEVEKPAPVTEEPALAKKSAEESDPAEESVSDESVSEEIALEESASEESAEEKSDTEETMEETSEEPAPVEIQEDAEPKEDKPMENVEITNGEVPTEESAPAEEPVEKTGENAEESNEEENTIISEPAEQEPIQRKTIEDYRELLESGNAAKAFTLGSTDVRLDPNGMSSIFTTLEGDTEVTVLEVAGDWICVLIGEDQIGYIYKDDLSGVPEETVTETEPAEEAEKTEEGEEPEVPAETEEEPAAEDPAADLKVTIFTSRRTVMVEGEYVILSSKLEGFDDYSVLYQWECDKGEGFQKVEGADSENYVFSADVESLSWSWRLIVYYR